MPDLEPRSLWWILMPWKYSSWRSRIVGCYSLFAMIYNALFLVFHGPLYYGLYLVDGLFILVLGIDLILTARHDRKMRRVHKTLKLWGRLIEGDITESDLTPEQREDIAVQRATARLGRTEPPRDQRG